jgi:hypothetical protein
MKLYQNTLFGFRHKRWTRSEAIAYFIKGVARELKFFPSFFKFLYDYQAGKAFKQKWRKQDKEKSYFDFNGVKLPDISDSEEKLCMLNVIFEDTFLFHCYLNDNYDKNIVDALDPYMHEGPYGYVNGSFDVTVKKVTL